MSTTVAEEPFRVLVIVASTRRGRLGPAIMEWFTGAIRADAERTGVTVDTADVAGMGLPLLEEPEHPAEGVYADERTRAWSRRVRAADAVVIVTPEYNHGMPATLKNALDLLYHEWAWKPVAFVSYGNTSAGTRSVQMAKQVVTTLRMTAIGATVALRIADSTEGGRVRATPELDAAAGGILEELVRVGLALRPLRAGECAEDTIQDGPVGGLTVRPVRDTDLAELLVLQRCCWVQEALANQTLDLAPLRETLPEVQRWSRTWKVWCVRRRGRLIAAVRARRQGTVWHIGRLMVAPDQAGRGLGSWLLAHVERQAPPGTNRLALFTGADSHRNIGLYQRAGYVLTAAPVDEASGDSVYLTKRHFA
jgi:NAD(P)H-dependent FMN reductase/GNAT superfamily N-acetyltransferase